MISSRTSLFPFVAVAGMCLALQACGSSSSGGAGQESVPFSDPVDAMTLSTALTTGASEQAGGAFWECTSGDGNALLEYQLFSDGTGIETDPGNNRAQTRFAWMATSATSMVTTVASTGDQLTFTGIQFAGGDSVQLSASETFSLDCQRMNGSSTPTTPVNVPVGDNSLSYSGAVYPLTHGFEEVFSFSPEGRNDTHRAFEFQVADAEFRQLQITTGLINPLIIWRPNFATVWLRLDLKSPGAEDFQSATFNHESDDVDENGPEVAGKYFFNEGRFGIDRDGVDGIDADANEFIDVVGGAITVNRLQDSTASVSFDLSLEDGTTLRGSFSGLFPKYEY